MAVTTPQDVHPQRDAGSGLQEIARKHLWMHFSRMGGYDDQHEIPIIARGEGPYVWDDHGNRYLDGLSALFCCNAGHGRVAYAEAAAAQMKELDFYTNWSYAHPRSIELAERVATLTPGDLNHVFFTNSGSEAVEAAIKVSRAWHRSHGRGQRHKIISREVAYHGTTMGALTATGITPLKVPVRAVDAGRLARPEHQPPALARRTATTSGRPSGSANGSSSRGRRRSPR